MKIKMIAGSILVLGSVLAGQAYATGTTISSVTGSDGVATLTVPANTDGTAYVREGFVYTLSPDVMIQLTQSAVTVAVAGAHAKGQYTFAGTSKGGSIEACEDTASTTGMTATTMKSPSLTSGCP